MKNKKAVMGKIIMGIPVWIILLILILVYLTLAAWAAALKGPQFEHAATSISQTFILTEIIEFEEEKMLIIDALMLAQQGQEKYERVYNDIQNKPMSPEQREQAQQEIQKYANYPWKIKNAIKNALEQENKNNPKNMCFIVFQGPKALTKTIELNANEKDTFIKIENGIASIQTTGELDVQYYEDNNYLAPLTQIILPETNERLSFKYYYGECMHE